MNHYLLELEERFGDSLSVGQHLITEEDRQMVKYQLHRELRERDYHEMDKHVLRRDGHLVELACIIELDPEEWDVMQKYLPEWPTE